MPMAFVRLYHISHAIEACGRFYSLVPTLTTKSIFNTAALLNPSTHPKHQQLSTAGFFRAEPALLTGMPGHLSRGKLPGPWGTCCELAGSSAHTGAGCSCAGRHSPCPAGAYAALGRVVRPCGTQPGPGRTHPVREQQWRQMKGQIRQL